MRWYAVGLALVFALPLLRAQEMGVPEVAPAAEAEVAADEGVEAVEAPETPKGLHVSTWKVDGRLDYQLMNMDMAMTGMPKMSDTQGQLMAAELESTATIANDERDLLDLAVQWPYATQMEGVDGRGKEMHFGNAYGVYKLGLGKPNIRFGQFVAPFGNLSYYETHTRPLQSLYAENLGIRIDRGVSVEGFKGDYDYSAALMGGNGARGDNNHRPIVLGRVARRYDLPNGILTVGASGLYGSDMPRFSSLVDPVMEPALPEMPLAHSVGYTDKTRLALDAEYTAGANLFRAELVGGRDSDGSVNGQFLQWNRALNAQQETSLQVARWEQPTGNRLRLGGSFSQRMNDDTTLRLSAERSLGHIPGEDRNGTTVALQLLREFPNLLGK